MKGKVFHLACGFAILLLGGCGKNSLSTNAGIPTTETHPGKSTQAATLFHAVKEYSWKVGDPSVPLIRTDTGLCFLPLLSGHFAGFGEEVGVHPTGDGFWYLEGKGQQEGVAAKATNISSIAPAFFRSGVKQYEWSKGQAPVRMLNKNDGVCFLSGLSGNFAGDGEEILVRLADDGYWYLARSGSERNPLRTRALARLVKRIVVLSVN